MITCHVNIHKLVFMHTTSRIASMAAATVQSATKRATRSIAYLGPAGTYGEQVSDRYPLLLEPKPSQR